MTSPNRWYASVEELLAMKSNDAMVHYEEAGLDGITVADELTIDSIDDEYHMRIMKVMEREGINLVPVLVIDGVVYNGHRRIMIADELGLDLVLCTDDWADSGFYEDTIVGEENDYADAYSG